METKPVNSEKTLLAEIQNDLIKITKLFNQLTKVKTGEPEALDKFTKALKELPPGETIGKAIEEWRDKSSKSLEALHQERVQSFKRIETEFIKAVQAEGKAFKESAKGWRIGILELENRHQQSQVRFLYNHEVVLNWRPIVTSLDISKLENEALISLEKMALTESLLIDVFSEAFEQVTRTKRTSDMVPILEFYREVRIALLRHEMSGKAPHAKLTSVEFPRWAFLYNLDRYRSLGASVPVEKRLGLQTGSQQEVSRGKGMVINGLNALEDYKVMCYIIAARGRDNL